MDPLKMYFLLKMGIFHCYVSLPEGIYLFCASQSSIEMQKNIHLLEEENDSTFKSLFIAPLGGEIAGVLHDITQDLCMLELAETQFGKDISKVYHHKKRG